MNSDTILLPQPVVGEILSAVCRGMVHSQHSDGHNDLQGHDQSAQADKTAVDVRLQVCLMTSKPARTEADNKEGLFCQGLCQSSNKQK